MELKAGVCVFSSRTEGEEGHRGGVIRRSDLQRLENRPFSSSSSRPEREISLWRPSEVESVSGFSGQTMKTENIHRCGTHKTTEPHYNPEVIYVHSSEPLHVTKNNTAQHCESGVSPRARPALLLLIVLLGGSSGRETSRLFQTEAETFLPSYFQIIERSCFRHAVLRVGPLRAGGRAAYHSTLSA
ncbi:unnamed protein product [Leuciscus chuanchicus]